jgi:hypothetical protein
MAEYIDRAAAVKVILRERKPTNSVAQNRMLSIIQRDLLTMCAADVAPVVRCKDCENSYYVVDGLICSYGPCLECHVPPEFWCAYGKRREDAHAQD